MEYVDTHCHLDNIYDRLKKSHDLPLNDIASSWEPGFAGCVTVFSESFEETLYFLNKGDKRIHGALGIHPHNANIYNDEIEEALTNYLKHPQIVALGEIGLDFSKNYVDSKEKQIYAFRSVLNYIKGDNKIVSVHSRKAEKEVFELLQEYGTKNVIFHWYSGPLNLIDEIINAGYYFSINEAMTTSISGRKIISKIPLNRILTETDAPFNKHSNILNAISNIGLTEDVIYSNFLNLINAIV